ncbi:MAG TPA: undecaprenyl-diphosphate phosphatase, partial [Acidimicrobiales bacterium]|nr:undecaprenyl-diphosphate phosphatase [Acidimicrobiales bacterium]
TELFPISSLGHGVLVPALLGWHNLVSSQSASESFFLAFLVGLHVGTALALLVYYRATWRRLFAGLFRQIGATRERGLGSLARLDAESTDPQYRLLVLLVIATIPVGLTGLVLEHKLRVLFAKPLAAAIFLTINGVILLVGERLRRASGAHAAHRRLADLSPGAAFLIGCSQIGALFAGISRSGISMVAGLTSGMDHEDSANFSFLLATPVILAAGVLKLPDLMGSLGDGVRTQTLVGALFAAVAAYLSVRFLVRYFTTRTLTPFGVYSLLAGLACVIRFA